MVVIFLAGWAAQVLAASRVGPVANLRPWSDVVWGVYEGEVMDAGKMVPQTIRFMRDPTGRLIGVYTVHHANNGYEGQLVDARAAGPNALQFTWKDHHGEGVIRLEFDPQGNSFTGTWGVGVPDPDNVVRGNRNAAR